MPVLGPALQATTSLRHEGISMLKPLIEPSQAQRAPHTHETPRVGVVGCGGWGRNLVRNFAELGALEAIVDANAETVEALAGKHNTRVSDFASLIEDSGIDAVVIAAPASLHYDLAKRALLGGKHCFVEKPLALELAQAK